MLGILSILSGGVPIFLLALLLWVVLDLVWIGTRDFHDGQGRRIARWSADDTRHYQLVRLARCAFVMRHRNRRAPSRSSSWSWLASSGCIAFMLAVSAAAWVCCSPSAGLAFGGWLDIVRVVTGQLRDSEGKRVSEWE